MSKNASLKFVSLIRKNLQASCNSLSILHIQLLPFNPSGASGKLYVDFPKYGSTQFFHGYYNPLNFTDWDKPIILGK